MMRRCKSCDGNGSLFIRGVMVLPREKCDTCDGTGEVVTACEWCETPLDYGEVDICDRCAEEFDRQDQLERAARCCEFADTNGNNCIVHGDEHGRTEAAGLAHQDTGRRTTHDDSADAHVLSCAGIGNESAKGDQDGATERSFAASDFRAEVHGDTQRVLAWTAPRQ